MILGSGHPFPAGTRVLVYERSAFSGHLPDGEPNGDPVAEAVVSDVGDARGPGVCEFEGLAPGEYVGLSGETPARVRFTT